LIKKKQVDFYSGFGKFVDNKTIDINSAQISAQNFIIATGSSPKSLSNINSKIEDQLITASISNQNNETKQTIRDRTAIPNTSIFSEFHKAYLAPIVVGIIIVILTKLLDY